MSAIKSKYDPARRVRQKKIESTVVSSLFVLMLALLLALVVNHWELLKSLILIGG